MSELLSIALFLASVVLYAWKAGRNTWWFAATLTVLGLFVVLNITLYASDYFTAAVCRWGEVIPQKQAFVIERITKGKLKYDASLYQKATDSAA